MARRQVNSYITEAVFDLLEKKEFQQITVQDIVGRAGVCRASFYRNFFTIPDVIDQFLDDLFARAYPRQSMDADNMEHCILAFFQTAQEHRREMRLLLKRGLIDRVNVAVFRQTLSQIESLGIMKNKYQPHYFSGAAAATLCAWIKNDFDESPEKMTALFLELLSGYLTVR